MLEKTKQFKIPKHLVVQAYKLVKANAGAAGIDQQTLEDFERNLKDNLYKLWNRMSSGSYFPPSVKAVPIPKKSGGERILGVPTVTDRIAQMIVKLVFEPTVEPHFLTDSYGYRPKKSALDAIEITRQRCWQYSWVLEFDIKGLFDNIPRNLLMKAVKKHTDCKWILLYIKRWLSTPMQLPDGSEVIRETGTPQGSVISPVLSNLFLHYVFDKWMQRNYPSIPWCRYADDGLIHCTTEQQAKDILELLTERFQECGLQLHPQKTRIIYCKNDSRKGSYPNTSFDFLGYTFRPRSCKNSKRNVMFVGFTPSVSKTAINSMRAKLKTLNIRKSSDLNFEDIARFCNPILKGWINYYGRFNPSGLYPVWRYFNNALAAWVMRKSKSLYRRKIKATQFLEKISKQQPKLFAHWQVGMRGAFA
jgi:RNA-directed DNA polymerase